MIGQRPEVFTPRHIDFGPFFDIWSINRCGLDLCFSVLDGALGAERLCFAGAIIALPLAVKPDRRGAGPSGGLFWLCGLLAACCEA